MILTMDVRGNFSAKGSIKRFSFDELSIASPEVAQLTKAMGFGDCVFAVEYGTLVAYRNSNACGRFGGWKSCRML
jgi:hypothetical protein